MRLQVEKLKEEEIILDISEDANDFPALANLEKSGEYHFLGPVSGQLRALWANGYVEVEGRLYSEVRVSCSRCLADVDMPLEMQVSLTFSSDIEEGPQEENDEIELSADEVGLIPIEGEEIDLREIVAEQIVLALPFQPLCGDGCKGLCPQCGINRNVDSCQCSPPTINNKFAALKNFKVDK